MNRWDVYMVELPAPLSWHPIVILSPQAVLDNQKIGSVNGLLCSTVRGADKLGSREIELIVHEDGVRQKTACQCHALLLVPKRLFVPEYRLGQVQAPRRAAIVAMLKDLFQV